MRKKSKVFVKSNLNNATPEQLDKAYQNVVDAVSLLYKSVKERKLEKYWMKLIKSKFNH